MKLTNNLSIESLIEVYEKQGFDYQQMTQIKKGLISGIGYFAQVSNSKHDYTTQKLLTHLNARLKNSKAKTREREILKTFKSQTAPNS